MPGIALITLREWDFWLVRIVSDWINLDNGLKLQAFLRKQRRRKKPKAE
jgi:hypothetical protein